MVPENVLGSVDRKKENKEEKRGKEEKREEKKRNGCRWNLHLSSVALPVCICELLQLHGD